MLLEATSSISGPIRSVLHVCACLFSTQYGVDVNCLNSLDQTALEIVNKFTASGAAIELKNILTGQWNKRMYYLITF